MANGQVGAAWQAVGRGGANWAIAQGVGPRLPGQPCPCGPPPPLPQGGWPGGLVCGPKLRAPGAGAPPPTMLGHLALGVGACWPPGRSPVGRRGGWGGWGWRGPARAGFGPQCGVGYDLAVHSTVARARYPQPGPLWRPTQGAWVATPACPQPLGCNRALCTQRPPAPTTGQCSRSPGGTTLAPTSPPAMLPPANAFCSIAGGAGLPKLGGGGALGTKVVQTGFVWGHPPQVATPTHAMAAGHVLPPLGGHHTVLPPKVGGRCGALATRAAGPKLLWPAVAGLGWGGGGP